MDLQGGRRELKRDGYCVVRGLFTAAEVGRFRQLLCAASERLVRSEGFDRDEHYPNLRMLRGDIFRVPELRGVDYVAFDERVISCVRAFLGPDLVYHGDSAMQWGAGPRGFHKDCADRGQPAGLDWQGDYGLLRVAVYLQDHRAHSGGLKVRRGSHRLVSHHAGRAVNLDTVVGDAAFWFLTTSHSGNVIRPRIVPGLCLHPRVENAMPNFLRLPESEERVTVFCTFGVRGAHLDHYVEYQTMRADVRKHWLHCATGAEYEEIARRVGVSLLRPAPDFGALARPPESAAR